MVTDISKLIRQQFDELCQSRQITVPGDVGRIVDALIVSVKSEVAGWDDLRMWDHWPKECPTCQHKDDPDNPKGVWWDHDGMCSNCGKNPLENDAAVKLIDDLMLQLQKDIDDCLVCKDKDEPCLVCAEHARTLGSIDGMRDQAKAETR